MDDVQARDDEQARQRKLRQRLTFPYGPVLEQAKASNQGVHTETAVYCTAVLELTCSSLLQSAILSAQDDCFWNRKGKVRGVQQQLCVHNLCCHWCILLTAVDARLA